MSRATHLKIKIKYLACESRIIRKEEDDELANGRKCLGINLPDGTDHRPELEQYASGHYAEFKELRDHRLDVVRTASRRNLLAYGFLRGRSYAEMEHKTRTFLDFRDILKILKRFGSDEDLSRWDAWQEAAIAHLTEQGFSGYSKTAAIRKEAA
mgnify:CR=1 FL=1